MNHSELAFHERMELADWLEADGYTNVEEWAEDSDYHQDDDDQWYDEEGNPVDIEVNAWHAMEAERDWDENHAHNPAPFCAKCSGACQMEA